MRPDATPVRSRFGVVLVALQFGLIAVLGTLAAPAFISAQAAAAAVAWILFPAGLALMAWSLCANRPGNFNIHPVPRAGGQLVQQGPYRWVRHPMYTAVFLCALGCLWARPTIAVTLAATALVVVLATKAALEERWMRSVHPDYAAYQARTRRFVPGLY